MMVHVKPVCACTHVLTNICIYTVIHSHTHACTLRLYHTHARTHTHTHTRESVHTAALFGSIFIFGSYTQLLSRSRDFRRVGISYSRERPKSRGAAVVHPRSSLYIPLCSHLTLKITAVDYCLTVLVTYYVTRSTSVAKDS